MSDTPRKLSKHEMKRQQQYMERRQRTLNRGVPEDQVDMVMAQEDYDSLPVEKKIKRLEQMIKNLAVGMSRDITNLIENDRIMADTYDINVRVIKRLLNKLGLESSVFDETVLEVEAEWKAELEAQDKARKDAMEQAEIEKALITSKQEFENAPDANADIASGPYGIPDGATSFGG